MAYNFEYPYVDSDRANADWLLNLSKDIANRMKVIEDAFKDIEVMTPEEIERLINIEGVRIERELSETITEAYRSYVQAQWLINKVYVDERDENAITVSQNFARDLSVLDRAYTDSKLVDASYMISPITGKREDVRKVVDDIVTQFHSADSLTASEYDALSITANAYDNKQLSAYDYDYKGKNLLP